MLPAPCNLLVASWFAMGDLLSQLP